MAPAERALQVSAPAPAPVLALVLALALTSACDTRAPTISDEPTSELLVFAAASLTDALAEAAEAFEAAHPGIDVILNLAGSSTLREQILEGAPADVFMSANSANMDQLVAAGAATDPRIFATNRLVIAVPAGNPAGIAGLDDFAREDLLIGLCAEAVPCGDFARRALDNAGVTPEIDTNEPDVRALLTKVAAGELDAGIVYVTDIVAPGFASDVDGVDIPADVNVVAGYPMAALNAAPNRGAANEWVTFITSEAGRSILARHGFGGP